MKPDWRLTEKYPEPASTAGHVVVRCEIETTAQLAAMRFERQYGARTESWRLPNRERTESWLLPDGAGGYVKRELENLSRVTRVMDEPDEAGGYVKGKLGNLSHVKRVMDDQALIVLAVRLSYPTRLPSSFADSNEERQPGAVNVIEIVLGELSPAGQAKTSVSLIYALVFDNLVNTKVEDYVDKMLDAFLEDYHPNKARFYFSLYGDVVYDKGESSLQTYLSDWLGKKGFEAEETRAPEAINVIRAKLEELKPNPPGLDRWRVVPVNSEIIERRKRVAELKELDWRYEDIARELTVSTDTVKNDLQALRLTRGRNRKG